MKQQFYILLLAVILFSACGKKMEETKPIRQNVTETVFASGQLEANGTYNLTAQTDGYLSQVLFEEGDVVSGGKVLATIDNRQNVINQQSAEQQYQISKANTLATAPALQQQQAAIKTARDKLQLDSVQWQRYKRLLDANSVARIDYDNVLLQYQNSQASYRSAVENYRQLQTQAQQSLVSSQQQKSNAVISSGNNQIKAVVNGRIYKKLKQKGDFVRQGDVIATIGNPSFIYAKVNVDETNISKVKVGQDAEVQLNTSKNKIYKGQVSEIFPAFDEATQSFICKIHFTDALDFTITGTQLQCNIVIDTIKNALLIPRAYLDFGGHVQIKGQKQSLKVQTGFVSSDWVQVLNGIDDNTVLVTENIAANKTTTSEVGSQFH